MSNIVFHDVKTFGRRSRKSLAPKNSRFITLFVYLKSDPGRARGARGGGMGQYGGGEDGEWFSRTRQRWVRVFTDGREIEKEIRFYGRAAPSSPSNGCQIPGETVGNW